MSRQQNAAFSTILLRPKLSGRFVQVYESVFMTEEWSFLRCLPALGPTTALRTAWGHDRANTAGQTAETQRRTAGYSVGVGFCRDSGSVVAGCGHCNCQLQL